MYMLKPGVKRDPERRWALPDRVFFGRGACHILAGVFLRAPPVPGMWAEHIVPRNDRFGAHMYVTDGVLAFDYHGYSARDRLFAYHCAQWRRFHGGDWDCDVERVAYDPLDTVALNARKMLGPDQYRHDPIPRAERFIARIDPRCGVRKALRTLSPQAPPRQPGATTEGAEE